MSSAIEACVNAGGLNNNSDLRFKTTLDYNNPLIERMRIDRGGNVGIGTEDPDEKLHVYGSIKCHNTGTTGDEKGLFLHSTSDWYNFSPGNDGYLHLLGGASGQGHMSGNYSSMKLAKLIAQGNVGINGSASPQQALEVHGNILLGENNVSSFIHGGSHTAMTSDANILIVADSNDTSGATGGNIIFGTGSNVNMDSSRNCTFAQAFPDNLPRVEHMRIVGSSGKVGIGTATPYAKLQVDIADASAASATWDATKVVFGDITNGNSQGLGFGVSTNSHASIISLAPGVAWRGLGYYSAWHKWYINNVEKMALDASGNVGIGTPSPGTKLHVQSVGTGTTVLITGPTQGNSGGPNNDPWTGLEFQRLGTNGETYNGSVNLRAYRWATSGQDPAMALRFNLSSTAPYNTADVMTLRSDGNVGIGTTSPVGVNGGKRLEGSSSTGFEYIATRDDTSTQVGDFIGAYLFKNGDFNADEPHYAGIAAKEPETFGNMDLHFYTGRDNYENDTPQMTINTSGNVGIGTADPQGRLHISSGTSGDCHLIIQSDTDNNNEQDNPKIVFRQDGAINTAEIGIENTGGNPNMLALRGTAGIVFYDGDSNTGDIDKIQSTSTELMRIESTGMVGIDDSTPTHRFTVANRHGIEADGYWARYRVGTGLANNYRLYFRSSSMDSSAGGGADNVSIYVNNLFSANDASDDRIKTDEVLVENATQTLLKLKPQTYTKDIFEFDELTSEEYSNTESTTDGYVFSPTHDRWRKRRFAGRPQKETGLIIQDIWYDAPELRHIIRLADDAEPAEERPNIEDIQQDPDYDALGWGLDASQLKYQQLIPYLIKSNQEIYTELQAEKTKTTTLETKLQEAEAKIATLQAEKEAIRSDLSSLVLRVAALES
jgi:hypothetical protein